MTTWIKYVDLANKLGDPQFVYVSESTAIQCARESVEAAGHFNVSDGDLLDNFLAVHWATKANIEELP